MKTLVTENKQNSYQDSNGSFKDEQPASNIRVPQVGANPQSQGSVAQVNVVLDRIESDVSCCNMICPRLPRQASVVLTGAGRLSYGQWQAQCTASAVDFRRQVADVNTQMDSEDMAAVSERLRDIGRLVSMCEDGGSLEPAELIARAAEESAVKIVSDGGKFRLVLLGGTKKSDRSASKFFKKDGKRFGNEVKNAAIGAAFSKLAGQGAYSFSGALANAAKQAAQKKAEEAKRKAMTKILGSGFAGQGFYRGMGAYRGGGSYRGSGSYETQYNSLFPSMNSDGNRAMHVASANNETGNIVIRKREYLFDVFSPSTPASFTTNKFQANPGLGALGPFVAQLAGNYEKFRYKQLVFTYKPVVTDSSSTGQMGNVLLAFNSNAGAQNFVTKQQMAEYDGSMSVRICDEAVLGVECDPKKGADSWLFVRTGSVPEDQDVKTYDFGSFVIATSGLSSVSFPAGTQLGELWVDYTVELAGPKLYDGMGYSILTDSFYGLTNVSSAQPIGNVIYKSNLNSLGGKLMAGANTRYTFPDNVQGWFRLTMSVYGAVATNAIFTKSVATILEVPDFMDSTQATVPTMQINAVGGSWAIRFTDYYIPFATSAGGNYFTLSANITTGTVGWFRVDQINPQPGVMSGVGTNYVPN